MSLGGSGGQWRGGLWWELSSLGELKILEAEGGKCARPVDYPPPTTLSPCAAPLINHRDYSISSRLVSSIQLAHVQQVGRTKGHEYYEFCIDIDVEASSSSSSSNRSTT